MEGRKEEELITVGITSNFQVNSNGCMYIYHNPK